MLALVTRLGPEEGSWTWESENPGFQSWLCGCVTWGRSLRRSDHKGTT